MGVFDYIPKMNPDDDLLLRPVLPNDGGEATRHNIKVLEERERKERLKKEKK